MSYKDYYQVLGVSRGANQDEIATQYRKLARKYHPDVSKDPNAEVRFKELGEAYDVLKDPEKRKLYDQYGESWKAVSEGRQPPPGADRVRVDFESAGFDPSDLGDLGSIFDQFFQRGRGHWRSDFRSAAHGADVESEISLTVEEAYAGGSRVLVMTDPVTGGQRRLTVKIPPGVLAGQRIRLGGQGGAGPSKDKAGDLYLRVRLTPSADFRLEDDAVHTVVPVAPWEAALGATVSLKTLDGVVRLKVPPGSSTGQQMRLKGKGYPRRDGARGDLFAEIRVVVPEKLSDKERELMQQLAEVSSFRPRPEDRGEA